MEATVGGGRPGDPAQPGGERVVVALLRRGARGEQIRGLKPRCPEDAAAEPEIVSVVPSLEAHPVVDPLEIPAELQLMAPKGPVEVVIDLVNGGVLVLRTGGAGIGGTEQIGGEAVREAELVHALRIGGARVVIILHDAAVSQLIELSLADLPVHADGIAVATIDELVRGGSPGNCCAPVTWFWRATLPIPNRRIVGLKAQSSLPV